MKLPMIIDGGLVQQGQWSDLAVNGQAIIAPPDTVAGNLALGTDNFGHNFIYARDGQTAAVTDTLPTGAAMDAYYTQGGVVTVAIGTPMLSIALNNGAFPQTIASGTGFTVVAGSDNIMNPGCRADVLVTRIGVANWTYKILTALEGPGGASWYRTALATVGAGAVTPALLAADVLARTGPTAAYADTLPLGTAMEAYAPFTAMPIGTSNAIQYSNQVAFAATLTAAAGFTVTGNSAGVVAANTVRLALITKLALNSYTLELL